MSKFQAAHRLVEQYFPGEFAPQSVVDWNGPFALHPDVVEFYTAVGPLNVLLPAYGDPCFLPRLADLWSYQAGYRWNGLTGKLIVDWPDQWLVIADQGADPFIFSRETGVVYHDRHGGGKWEPKPIFPTLEAMVTCLLVIASVVPKSERDLTDKQGPIKETYRQQVIDRLFALGESPDSMRAALKRLGW